MWCWTESVGRWMPVGWLFMVLFWAAMVVAGVWLISRLVRSSSSGTSTGGGNGALAAARERYATGAITKEEFDEIKRNLS